jgi:hypothetical protein
VHLATRSSSLVQRPAARLLGEHHPLALALDRRTSVALELLVVGVLLGGGLIEVAAGARWALPFALAAAVAAVPVWLRLSLVRACIRDEVLALLAPGRERLPLAEVQKERRRLLDGDRRRTQAEWLERVAEGRDLGFGIPGRVPTLISPRVARGARHELLEVAAAVRGGAPGVAGLALLEQLAYHPWSPLFDDDVRALQEALSRVRFLLAT